MKKIKIRFVARAKNVNSEITDYLIQKKTIFGWRHIKFLESGYGGSSYSLYCADSKEELLSIVFKRYLHSCQEFYEVIEYPMIKTY
jgi:hypothetical protein